MIYGFDRFELDLAAVELRAGGQGRSLEPQVFALLALLVANRERLVSKEEIIEKVWDGRIVSDAAIASRVKSARQALGDDGKSQRFIKTLHSQGYRFVARGQASRSSAAVATAESGDTSAMPASEQWLSDWTASPALRWPCCRFVSSAATSATRRSRARCPTS